MPTTFKPGSKAFIIINPVAGFSDGNSLKKICEEQFHAAGWQVPDRGVSDDKAAGSQAPTAGPGAEEHLLEIGPSGAEGLQQPSNMPGALVEPLFITHPDEADVAIDPKGVHAMAAGLSQAVAAFFGAGAPAPTATP